MKSGVENVAAMVPNSFKISPISACCSHASLAEGHVAGVPGHEARHQGGQVEVAGVDGLAALEPEAPVGDDGEAEQPRQHQAALVGDQVHDREVELLLLEAGEQPRVLQHHLAVDVGDAVEVGGQLVRVVSLVPDDRSLHSNVITRAGLNQPPA